MIRSWKCAVFACARQNQFVTSKHEINVTSWDRRDCLVDSPYKHIKNNNPRTKFECFEIAKIKGYLKIVDVFVAKNHTVIDQENKRVLVKNEYQLTDKGEEFIRRNGNV